MRSYSRFGLLMLVYSHAMCFAGDEFISLKDFSGKVLVSEAAKKCSDVMADNDAMSSSLITESLAHSSVSGECALIDLKCMAINDMTFDELTTSLLARTDIFQGKQLVFDLSDNGITPNSVLLLKQLLDRTGAVYVNLCGNTRCAMKNVRELCSAFMKVVDGDDESSKKALTRTYMAKVVFLSKYYLWYAKNRVKTYSALCEAGLLQDDWAEKHRDYYKTVEKVGDDGVFKLGELKEDE